MMETGTELDWPELHQFGTVEVLVGSDEIIMTVPDQETPDESEARAFIATLTEGPASYAYGPDGEVVTFERTRAL